MYTHGLIISNNLKKAAADSTASKVKVRNTFLIGIVVFLLSACSTYPSKLDYDGSYEFNLINSYYIEADTRSANDPLVSEIEVNRLHRVLDQVLSKRFTAKASKHADVIVSYQIVTAEESISRTYDTIFYRRPYFTSPTYVENKNILKVRLIVNIRDRESEKVIWHGIIEGLGESRMAPEKREALLLKRIETLMSGLPE